MKILFLTSNLKLIGGKERYDRNVISVLREKASVEVVELRGTFFLWKAWFAARAFGSALFFRPDVIFCALINFSPICIFLRKIFGTEYLIFTHGVEVWNIQNNIHARALREAKLILTVSHFTEKKIQNQIPEVAEKIRLVPNTVNERAFDIQKIEKKDNTKTILSVSRLYAREKYKGYDKVVEALPRVKQEIPNIQYILVGKGDDAERIRALAREYECEENLIMPGRVSDEELREYYNMADVFVLPSRGEGFGVVFLEALASGVPVIAGNKDASEEAVLGGKLGILVDPDNVKEIAQAIIKILKKEADPHFFDREYLRREALRVYGFDRFRRQMVELLHELEA